MGGLSWWHWLIIIAAFVLLFGARKLPDAARGLGRSLRILKSEVNAMHEDDEAKDRKPSETDATAQQPTPPAQIAAAPMPQQPVAAQPVYQAPPAVPVQQPVAAQPVVPAPEPVSVPQTDQYSDPTRPAGS
ncbi:Sec-independent protein translocase subunit TatA [Nakamurella lactea]|uniref:Sec-independent protein translocase subunit TatA n=1 Tax=Nakamurella lactea TaxID=459515 RepID=UPI00041D9BDB|nr:Sec-independent protein translocase subunit TatA [Nakamurella lactea]